MDPRSEGLLAEFLDEWKEDRREGRTMRALHERLDIHELDDQRRFGEIDRRQSETDLARAREQGIAEGTGRIKRSDSLPPWARGPIVRGIGKGVAVLAVGLAGWLLNELRGHTPAQAQQTHAIGQTGAPP